MQLPSILSLAEKMLHLTHSLDEALQKIAKLEDNSIIDSSIPIGFTYVQLPKDKAPNEL